MNEYLNNESTEILYRVARKKLLSLVRYALKLKYLTRVTIGVFIKAQLKY